MRYVLLLLLFCSIFFLSCASLKKEVISKSTIKLEGKNTNIRDLIQIDGCYPVNPSNTMLGYILFFDDGTWVYFHTKLGISDDLIRANLSKSIIYKKNQLSEWGTNWGIYKIKNDTIIVHSYEKPGFMVPIDLNEKRYKIINQNTIQQIFFKVRTDDKYYESNSPWRNFPVTHFIPADSLPSSDNWLKEKKWIWRNESDWNRYMQHIKDEKMKKKTLK